MLEEAANHLSPLEPYVLMDMAQPSTSGAGEIKANLEEIKHLGMEAFSLYALPLEIIEMILLKTYCNIRLTCKTFQDFYLLQEKAMAIIHKDCTPLLARNELTYKERNALKTHYIALAKILFDEQSCPLECKSAGRMIEKFFTHFSIKELADLSPACSGTALEAIADWNIPLFAHFLFTKDAGAQKGKAIFLQEKIKTRFGIDSTQSFCRFIEECFTTNNRLDFCYDNKKLLLHYMMEDSIHKDLVSALTPLFLADSKIGINIGDKSGYTPLMLAARNQSATMIKQLLDKGADVNLQDKEGVTPLMAAVWLSPGNTLTFDDAISALLDRGAKIDIADNDGRTALMYACDSSSSNLIKQLLDKGADINLQDKKGKTPLMYAIITPRKKARIGNLSVLLKGDSGINAINIVDDGGNTPLMRACLEQDIFVVKLLLAHNANMSLKNKEGHDVFALAQTIENEELQEVIIGSYERGV